ncbi:dihydroorotase [Nostoc sp. FACHB-892]|uniref:dihydroorotase n=1 Tax=Nostoc sp. FACHB-892 TaxID=2692843 RepID=UPI00168394D0|nr:dihydroorotase [Nostoc sp. FACHB-892]MBD2727239.1 dihydroorotase [Nostoc sp. FACHB-892]
MTELLQKVRVIDPVSEIDELFDVLIGNGSIQAVASHIADISPDTQIRDCQGLVLGPGLVDLYSHSGEPGFEERETLLSLLQSATAGGFTRVNILPDTSPAIDNPALVAQLQQKRCEEMREREKISLAPPITEFSLSRVEGVASQRKGRSQSAASPLPLLHLWGAITLDVAGKQMTEFADLASSGVVGFTDGKPFENLALVRRVLEYLQPLGKLVAFRPSDRQLSANGVMREGPDALRFGLPPIPASAETTAIAAMLELVAAIGTPVHIMRVSTSRSVELIASAKAAGLPITASTTWMHLLLDTKAVKSYNTSLHLDPPLGNPSDVAALRAGVRAGVIDAIAIDHTPYSYEEKVQAFAEAPPGAIGLELALPLLWQYLVETEEFTALELWRALSTNPAECLGQKVSAIVPHQPAELTLFDPQETWKVERKNLYTLSQNTPWLGQQVKGRVVQTWC